MSLDITSHLDRPGSDELVPSRYALRVGEIDVLVISDGAIPLPAATLATNADPAELAAWLDDMQPSLLPVLISGLLSSAKRTGRSLASLASPISSDIWNGQTIQSAGLSAFG